MAKPVPAQRLLEYFPTQFLLSIPETERTPTDNAILELANTDGNINQLDAERDFIVCSAKDPNNNNYKLYVAALGYLHERIKNQQADENLLYQNARQFLEMKEEIRQHGCSGNLPISQEDYRQLIQRSIQTAESLERMERRFADNQKQLRSIQEELADLKNAQLKGFLTSLVLLENSNGAASSEFKGFGFGARLGIISQSAHLDGLTYGIGLDTRILDNTFKNKNGSIEFASYEVGIPLSVGYQHWPIDDIMMVGVEFYAALGVLASKSPVEAESAACGHNMDPNQLFLIDGKEVNPNRVTIDGNRANASRILTNGNTTLYRGNDGAYRDVNDYDVKVDGKESKGKLTLHPEFRKQIREQTICESQKLVPPIMLQGVFRYGLQLTFETFDYLAIVAAIEGEKIFQGRSFKDNTQAEHHPLYAPRDGWSGYLGLRLTIF